MSKVHFSHANGFPAQTYSYLFEHMDSDNIHYIDLIGHGDFPLNGDLNNYAKELIHAIQKDYSGPVIGIGHSLGGVVTFLAAAIRPDLFTHLILLDPVVFSAKKRLLIWLLKKTGAWQRYGLVGKSLKRRNQFSGMEEVASHFSTKFLFKNFEQRCFQAYLDHGFVASEDGVELAFDRNVEADIFDNILMRIPKICSSVSGTIIYGNKSDTFNRGDLRWWNKNIKNFEYIPIDGGHLFPLEIPETTANVINSVIREISLDLEVSNACA